MPEETHLDPAIPRIGWQDAGRDEDLPDQPPRRPKKRRPPASKPETARKPAPGEGRGTRIDVTV